MLIYIHRRKLTLKATPFTQPFRHGSKDKIYSGKFGLKLWPQNLARGPKGFEFLGSNLSSNRMAGALSEVMFITLEMSKPESPKI
jgi:hypothetical protein